MKRTLFYGISYLLLNILVSINTNKQKLQGHFKISNQYKYSFKWYQYKYSFK